MRNIMNQKLKTIFLDNRDGISVTSAKRFLFCCTRIIRFIISKRFVRNLITVIDRQTYSLS